MKTFLAFVTGLLCGSLLIGFCWYSVSTISYKSRTIPPQIAFNSAQWKVSDSGVRGQMYKDLIRYIEIQRPKQNEIIDLLGPSGYIDQARLNDAEYFYIYHIDLGQRISGKPFLDKVGIAFDEDGNYSHTAVWD